MNETVTSPPADMPNEEALAHTERGLFFIVGCGRSGTSLLQMMLASHPAVTMPNETGFYAILWRRHPRLRNIRDDAMFDRVLAIVLSSPRIRAMGLDEARVRALAKAGKRSWETILLAILTTFREQRGCDRVGEKSPEHIHYTHRIVDGFPNARIIHIVRDPRAVVLSLSRTPFAGRFVGRNITRWQKAILQHRRYADALGPERYRLVRYEDLVSDAERTLTSLCSFLDLPFDRAMLRHESREEKVFASWQEGHMANTLKPVFTSSIEKWKTDLSRRHIALIEHALREDMALLGYEPTGAATPLPDLQLALSRSAGLARRIIRRALLLTGLRKAPGET